MEEVNVYAACCKERSADESTMGTLPDFVIIGSKKGGTTFYNILTQHPHIEPAARKELHYFDILHKEEDVEWYRQCFSTPR